MDGWLGNESRLTCGREMGKFGNGGCLLLNLCKRNI